MPGNITAVPIHPHHPNHFDAAVVIPTHAARGQWWEPDTLLGRAVASVRAQTLPPRFIVVAEDRGSDGAAVTRQRALDAALMLNTEWVTFLDSDDTWYPNHLETHHRLLTTGGGGDVAYSWFDGNVINDWETTHRGKVWDPAEPHHTTMTITVRTSFAECVSFVGPDMHSDWTGEDWRFITGLNAMGARFVGTGEVTFTYHVHGGNTSGSPRRGDASNG